MIAISAKCYAQETKLSLNMQRVSFYEVFSEIEKQTEFVFIYKSDDINRNPKISIQAVNKPLMEILDEILKNTQLTYVVNNRHILISRKKNVVTEKNASRQFSENDKDNRKNNKKVVQIQIFKKKCSIFACY
jgi:hypothetical protein